MGGVKVNGGPEITKMNRPVQAALLAGTVLPQAWCFATQSGPSAPEQLAQWWAWSTQDAAGWLLSASFLAAFLALAFERVLYTIVWIRPKAWMAMSKTQPFVRLGSPVDVVCAGFSVSKVLQIGSFVAWYAAFGPFDLVAVVRDATRLQWVCAAQGIFLGQLLNMAIYKAIGKNGVYYGYKLGRPVPWCTTFPFNAFTAHPQYVGCIATIVGLSAFMATEAHVKNGWLGLSALGSLMYVYMAIIEQYC
jgi:hypothetical protein